MHYLMWYLGIGLIFTAAIFWRSWKSDPTPLEFGEMVPLLMVLAVVTVAWPLFTLLIITGHVD